MNRLEPWTLLSRWHRDLGQVMGNGDGEGGASIAWTPLVDVREEPDRFIVEADVPGVTTADIEISAEKGVLTIRGQRRPRSGDGGDPGFARIERPIGTFMRRFSLPENAQADAIKARLVNGVLEVGIPKQPELAARRINVESA